MEALSTTSQPSNITHRNLIPIASPKFHSSLLPNSYSVLGTSPTSKLLFINVIILKSTGRDLFHGDVLILGEQIRFILEGRGRTSLSGLGDAHTNLTWNEGDLNALGEQV